MSKVSEDEAYYKLAQAEEFIRKIESDKELLGLIKMMIENGLTEQARSQRCGMLSKAY